MSSISAPSAQKMSTQEQVNTTKQNASGRSKVGPRTSLMNEHEPDERIKKINKEAKFYMLVPVEACMPRAQLMNRLTKSDKEYGVSDCLKSMAADLSTYEFFEGQLTPNQFKALCASNSMVCTYCISSCMTSLVTEVSLLSAGICIPFPLVCLGIWTFCCILPASMATVYATRYFCCDPKTQ